MAANNSREPPPPPVGVGPNGTRITQAGMLLGVESRDLLGRYFGGSTHPPITHPGGRHDSGYSHTPTPAIRFPARATRQAARAAVPQAPLAASGRAGVPA